MPRSWPAGSEHPIRLFLAGEAPGYANQGRRTEVKSAATAQPSCRSAATRPAITPTAEKCSYRSGNAAAASDTGGGKVSGGSHRWRKKMLSLVRYYETFSKFYKKLIFGRFYNRARKIGQLSGFSYVSAYNAHKRTFHWPRLVRMSSTNTSSHFLMASMFRGRGKYSYLTNKNPSTFSSFTTMRAVRGPMAVHLSFS